MRRTESTAILAVLALFLLACRANNTTKEVEQPDSGRSVPATESPLPAPNPPPTTINDKRPLIVCFGDSLTAGLGTEPVVLDNFDSYECRGFNRISGAHLSEHGRANALDVRAIKLANGQSIGLTDRAVSRDLRETVLRQVCARFMTVLGPGSDWYHEDHIHLDLMERRNDYRICQWNVWDPLPQLAPLLPAERPEEAPPREVAAKSAKPDDKPKAAEPDAVEPQSATKKRRQNRRF